MLESKMSKYFSLVFIFFCLVSIIVSVKMILIGKNIIKHPMYDNEEKRSMFLNLELYPLFH